MSRPTTNPSLPAAYAAEGRAQPAVRWALPAALVLTLAPFVVAAARMLASRGAAFHYAGDQAIIGLAVHDASHLHQLLGPYSRYGWSHPGPSWFYLLAPFYNLLGSDDAALVASSILVQGVFAVAVVAAVHRFRRPALTLLAAGIVLLYVLRMPASLFVDVWNPFALLLATAVFLVLVGRARDGRWSSLVLLLIAGSYLAQTHIGTAPMVAAGGITGLVAFVLGRRGRAAAAADNDSPPAASATGRSGWVRTAILTAALVAMWLPTLIQQATSPLGQGNLGRIVDFFLFSGDHGAHPTIGQAVIATGRLLAMTPYGWGPGPWQMDVSTLPAAVALGLVAQAVASLALAAAGRRWGAPRALWTGVVTFVALLAAIASARTVSDGLYWYLLIWVSVLPAVTLIGAAELLLDRQVAPGAQPALLASVARWSTAMPLLVASAVMLAAGAGAVAVSLSSAVDALPGSPGVSAAERLVDGALQGRPPGDIEVNIQTHDRWPIGAGLVEELTDEGWGVHVGPQNADLFGAARVARTRQPLELVLIAPDDPKLPTLLGAPGTMLGSVDTENGPVAILLETTR